MPPVQVPPLRPGLEARITVAADIIAFGIVVTLLPSLLPGLSLPFVLVTMSVAVVTWRVKSLYTRRMSLSVLDDLPALATGVLVGLAPATALSVLFGGYENFERRVLLVGVGIVLATALCRWVGYSAMLALRRRKQIFYPTVMIGSGAGSTALVRRIEDHPEAGLRLVGRLGSSARRCGGGSLPYLGDATRLASVVRDYGITNLIIGYGGMHSSDLVEVLRTADRANLEIHVVPRLFEMSTHRGGDDQIWGLPLARLRTPADHRLTRPVKRVADIAGALVALVLTAPLLAVVAAAVRVELGPGIFFRQIRLGAHGTPFELIKLRSMRDSVSAAGGRWTVADHEIGPVGRFIRRYSLDELPQLWNVLRGDMSMVGPRPERPEFVERFVADYPWYAHRHRMPVGMTGLAAVNGLRGDTSIEERANFDNWYIENWSLWLDAKILLRTVSALLRGTGG